jgi:hypothetical protein
VFGYVPRASRLRVSAASYSPAVWKLADDTDVEILNVIDDHSRFLIASCAKTVFTTTLDRTSCGSRSVSQVSW